MVPNASINLQDTLPIFWQEEKNYVVSQGEDTVKFMLNYVSPCENIEHYIEWKKC